MLNMEPQPDILNLLKQLQESTTEDIDEERGSFKKGDKVTYDMFGSGLTNSDLIRTLDTNEHATRANHNGTVAKIVEAIGEEVARYSIVFEDGFIINDVAPSELKSVKEDEEGDMTSEEIKAEVISAISNMKKHTNEWSVRDTLKKFTSWGFWKEGEKAIVDVKTANDIADELLKYIQTDAQESNINDAYDLVHHYVSMTYESKTNEAEDAAQTMQPQEKPNINAEDYHMEDYSEEELNKPEVKVKSKSEETGNAIRQVEDDELEQKPDKVVTPKKESKLKEQEEDGDICVYCKKMVDGNKCPTCGRGTVDVSDPEKVLKDPEHLKSLKAKYFGEGFAESKLQEETEFTPSRSEMKKIGDEKLQELYKNALRSQEHWAKDRTAPEKVELAKQAVERYKEELVGRGIITGVEIPNEKKESKFSFMKKQDPLWLCNECFKTFRSVKSICENCKSENVEKITEQYGPGFTKEVFKVTWKNTDTGKEESTTVMAFDKADAKKEAKRSNREITKVEGPIKEEPRKEEAKVPFDQNLAALLYEQVTLSAALEIVDRPDRCNYQDVLDAIQKLKGTDQVKYAQEITKLKKYAKENEPVESKLHEDVQELVREVPGIDKEEQEILLKAIEDGVISNEWPSEDEMLDTFTKAGIDPAIVDFESWLDLRFAYLKHILLTQAMKATRDAKESKVNEGERLFQTHVETFLDNWLTEHGEEYHGLPRPEIMHMFEEDFRAALYTQLGSKGIGESKMDEQEEEGVPEKGKTYQIHRKLGIGLPDGVYEVTNVEYRRTVKGDLAKQFQIANSDKKWWVAKFYGFKEVASESKVEEIDVRDVPTRVLVDGKPITGFIKNSEAKTIAMMLKKAGMSDEKRTTFEFEKSLGYKGGGPFPRESKVNEQEEDWDLTFQYKHNLIWHNPVKDREGNPFIWQKHPIKGKRIRVFTDHQAEWAERNKAIPVRAELGERERKVGETDPITAIEIVSSEIDPDAYNIRVVELPEGSIVILDSVSDREEAIKRGKEFARNLNAKFLGIVDEKKVEEQDGYVPDRPTLKQQQDVMARLQYGKSWYEDLSSEEKKEVDSKLSDYKESKLKEQEEDTFQTVAKGIVDKADADKLAREKDGQVVNDEEDEGKFAVIVRTE